MQHIIHVLFDRLNFRANDDPHGIFALEPQNQRIVVTSRMTRLLRVNVTRVQGTFGTVTVEFSFRFDEVSKSHRNQITNEQTHHNQMLF